ncbi:phospholipase C type enzyme [Leucoagaricus gongylophorus]
MKCGALGAGLAIFSRFPFIETSVHPYSLNGEPIDVGGGDWFVGKAAASVVILHPVIGRVQIFNTHLYAKGGEDGPDYRRAHRLVGAWEYAKLARQAAELGRYVIGLGDFNSIPTTLPMTIIREHAALHDSWAVVHPNSDSLVVLNPKDAIIKHGITADSPVNTWSAGKSYLDSTFFGKRLDYILYRQPRGKQYPQLRATECKVVLTDKVPRSTFSYSDHFGLEATIEIQLEPRQGQAESSSTYRNGSNNAQTELTSSVIVATVNALTECYRFSRERSRRELLVFVLCLVLLVGVAIGTAWFPHSWVNSIFIVFTVVVAWVGTTMLYEGYIFGNWERSALQNVIEELEIYQRGLEIQADTGAA